MLSLKFGRFLYNAISSYEKQDYFAADSFIDKALVINNHDFIANLWKIRVTVMQQKYDEAINIIKFCREIYLSTQLEHMLKPWEQFCLKQINEETNEDIDIITLNNRTDDLLKHYQHDRNYSFLDIVYVLLICLGITLLCVLMYFTRILSLKEYIDYIYFILFGFALSVFYYRKVILIPNIYISLRYGYTRLRQLCYSRNFISNCSLLILGSLVLNLFTRKSNEFPTMLNFIFNITFVPVYEELALRGFLYGYLKKYGRALSWTIVTIIFYKLHMHYANIWHIVLSILCLRVYDSEKTILAPILLHTLNNIMAKFF